MINKDRQQTTDEQQQPSRNDSHNDSHDGSDSHDGNDNSGDSTSLIRSDDNGVVTLTLNQPKQYNVLSMQMLQALLAELQSIAADTQQRVVVLDAVGKAFCAGHNLKQMKDNPDRDYQQRLFNTCAELMLLIQSMPQPVVAKVQGIATAAGCQLVAACDLAVASEEARFATSGINVGLFCSTPAVAVSRNLPAKQAFAMLITGEFIDAATAQAYGLVNRVVAASQLDASCDALVAAIMSKSPEAVRIGKQMFYQQLALPLPQAYAYASEVMADNMMCADAQEGIDAFVNKRQPIWQGR